MGIARFILIACMIWAVVSPVAADDTIYRYECDVHPLDESAGWIVGNLCEDPCTESVENGHFVLRWSVPADFVNFQFQIATPKTPPPPPTLWVEWRFRSNHPIGENFFSCDGEFRVDYAGTFQGVFMYGDAAISTSGDDFITGLDTEAFHTYRYESLDGVNFRISVDGEVFIEDCCDAANDHHSIALRGTGSCSGHLNTINEWDFVRYGTIGSDERIIAADPPAGLLNLKQFADLDTFRVTFDAANYVYIDDVTVETTGGTLPNVIATRRREGDASDTVEIVLDQPLPDGATTTFKFGTGLPVNCDPTAGEIVNCVEYTLPPAPFCGDGIVNQPGEQCDDGPDNSDIVPDACRETCTPAGCGDGVIDSGEDCDEGSANSDSAPDACRTDCSLPSCGDSVADSGEECDDGPGNSDTAPDACRTDCTAAGCGDAVLDTGEDCDEGTLNSDTRPDACRTDCRLAGCGDGLIDTGEICDDRGESTTCNEDCTIAECGDGTLNITAGEECDNGPANSDSSSDACRTNCLLPKCGDSVTDIGEDCDDGTESTTCDSDCSVAECGDGTLNVTAGEACDDGSNNSDTVPDACRTDCTSAKCGDNVTDTDEECDGTSDDACPGDCEPDCTCDVIGIPAVSHWGLVVLAVLLLMFSKRYFRRRAEALT